VKVKVITLDKIEYKIFPMDLEHQIYSEMLSEAQKQRQDIAKLTIEEADMLSEKIMTLKERILAKTVTPQPQRGHGLELYQEVINETNIVLERTKFFREQQK